MSELDDILGMANAESPDLPSNEEITQLNTACIELVDLQRRISLGEELLKDLKQKERRISEQVIPDMMDEIGFKSVELPDGRKVGYKAFYSGKINGESESEAFDWLEENEHGGVIKGALTVNYRRPQRDEVLALKKALEENGWDMTVKLSVHHSTLRALFKEVIEDGGTFPPDLFEVFAGRKTTIK